MLFLAPHPPVLVPRTRPLVVGRAPECDLPVPSPRASRNHAEVSFEGEHVIVRDLDSTNGTFVNGEKVEGTRVLRPGDRIGVGGSELTFCRALGVEGFSAGMNEDATVACTAETLSGKRHELLRGDLSQIPVAAVLQVLSEEKMTGSLAILSDEASARVWIEEGRPVHAQKDDLTGLEAALAICSITEGRFLCADAAGPPARTLDLTATELLLEASRRSDEDAASH
jgi:pSer/pThr/pTyr-binding forkhead associated (FHA) protein